MKWCIKELTNKVIEKNNEKSNGNTQKLVATEKDNEKHEELPYVFPPSKLRDKRVRIFLINQFSGWEEGRIIRTSKYEILFENSKGERYIIMKQAIAKILLLDEVK